LLLCSLEQTREPRSNKVILLTGPFVRERQVRICGAEIVQFVGSCWKRSFLQRRSRAPAVSLSGKARALSREHDAGVRKSREFHSCGLNGYQAFGAPLQCFALARLKFHDVNLPGWMEGIRVARAQNSCYLPGGFGGYCVQIPIRKMTNSAGRTGATPTTHTRRPLSRSSCVMVVRSQRTE
jgi:hypothetical protein